MRFLWKILVASSSYRSMSSPLSNLPPGCFWTVVLKKTLESHLDCKEIKQVYPKGNQPWIFIGGTDAEAEVQYFGHLVQSIDSLEKTLMLEKIEGRRRKGVTEDEMAGWHHWLDGHEFEWALGAGDGHGGLVCCSPWGRKELDMTEWLNYHPTSYRDTNTIKKKILIALALRFLFKKFYLFIYLAVLILHCCMGFSLAAENRGYSSRGAQVLGHVGSVVAIPGL